MLSARHGTALFAALFAALFPFPRTFPPPSTPLFPFGYSMSRESPSAQPLFSTSGAAATATRGARLRKLRAVVLAELVKV